MATKFIIMDRDTPDMLPACVQDYVPENHLVRFIVEIVDQLDLQPIVNTYAGKGKKPFHPALLASLIFYSYATGTFSSRKMEKNTYDSLAYRFICTNTHPDHDTIANFRKRFLKELGELFVQILLVAQRMGLLKLGTISLDGTKIKANASKHKALSWEHANKLEKQLQLEVEELMRLAEDADSKPMPEEMNVPEEIKRREQRFDIIAQAKAEIKARAQARFEKEDAEYKEKLAMRENHEKTTGKKKSGPAPKAPEAGPHGKDQVNLTDEESRMMPSNKGFDQSYNAQASVDIETHMIIENHVTQHSNDRQEISPALTKLNALPPALGTIDSLLADTGYYSESNAQLLAENKDNAITPYIAAKRETHNSPLMERFQEDPPLPENPTAIEAMRHRMQTRDGKSLYAKRKSTIETVFGIIKNVLGFRQFLLRGVDAVTEEWNLVCMAWNLKRMHRLMVA